MKKTKKTALTAAILAAAINLTSCSTDGSSESKSSDMVNTETTTCYEPSTDNPQEDYGSPVDIEELTEKQEIIHFDPENDDIPVVYGPPDYYD